MVMVDTSAWIEFFNRANSSTAKKVDHYLDEELLCIGDLIYCEVVQGIKGEKLRNEIAQLLLDLPQYEMVGFSMADKAADNFRLLRSKGVTIRKTIDVMIGTFCAENNIPLIHKDKDFDKMAEHIGLVIV